MIRNLGMDRDDPRGEQARGSASPETVPAGQLHLVIAESTLPGGLHVGRAFALDGELHERGEGAAVEQIVEDVVEVSAHGCRFPLFDASV